MKKATIWQRISGLRLKDAVPPLYRSEILKTFKTAGEYTLVLCAHTERDVVISTEVARALKKITSPAPNGIILVGTVFTEEAKELASRHGAHIVALRASKWTDESASQRQL